MEKARYIFTRLVAISVILYVLLLVLLYFNQESLIFQPTKLSKDFKFSYEKPFEEIEIPSFDGARLNGLLFKTNRPKGLVFFLHGNAGALDSWGNVADVYLENGYDCFILDYRGYGKSEGSIEDEAQFYQDATIAYKTVLKRYDEKSVIVLGYSIGTGTAAYLAATQHPKALILQAPYYNLKALSDSRFPFVPHFIQKYRFETNVFLPKITAPIFIFHGDKDQVIPFSNSVELEKMLKPGDRFFTLHDQDHLGINENPEYRKQVKILLQ